MDQLDGLLFYEKVLMGLGVLLFLALLCILIFKAVKGQSLKVILGAFLIPIVMIGWPSIEKIKYDNGVIEIVKLTREAEANPGDTATRQALASALREVEDAPVSNPNTLLKFSNAHAAIGDTAKAIEYADLALDKKPDFMLAAERRDILATPRKKIEQETQKVLSDPADSAARSRLSEHIANFSNSKVVSPETFLTIAKGQAAIGDTGKALMFIDSVLSRNPASTEGKNLKKQFNILFKPQVKSDSAEGD